MKKWIAAALALLMLLMPAALGEAGDRITWSNMALEMTEGEETHEADLSHVSLVLTAGKLDDVPTMQATLYREGNRTRRAVLQFIHGVAYFNMDYLTQPVALNLAAIGPTAQAYVEGLFESTANLMDFKLPPFEGVTIPRAEVVPLVSLLGGQVVEAEDGTQSASIDVPYETTKKLLEQLRRYGDAAPEAIRGRLDAVFKLIDTMMEGNSGFALKGTAKDGKKKSELTVDVYAVRDGVTAGEATATINATFAKNKVNATVSMRQAGFSMNIAEFDLTSKTKKARLECALNVMGMLDFSARLYPVDGAQFASVEATMLGSKYAATLTYGPQIDGNFIDFALELSDTLSLNASVDTRYDEAGDATGTFRATMRQGDGEANYVLNGDVAEGIADEAFYPVKDIGNAISLLDMTDAQRDQLVRDLKNISGIATRYFKRVADK